MILTPMRFKDYTWPHNPERYTVEYRRTVAAHKVPFGEYVLQDVGRTFRVMKGEGTFAGTGAYDQFRALASVFEEEGAGLLVHPVWEPARAYFVSLRLAEKPLPDFVRYTFEFWEDFGGYDSGLKRVEMPLAQPQVPAGTGAGSRETYIVRKGDTLWGIARRCGVELSALIRANPAIKNPNRIYPGDRVNIP